MSSKKRRRAAQLARFKKMDENYTWLYLKSSPRRDGLRSWRFWFGCIVALGDKLETQKPGAWGSLERRPEGTDILMHNYRKRHG